ncbi:MAG TPA: hypothetical protein VGG10_12000 [Rhizomicrobium sp.]|jgi:hypothetical protein
MTIAGLLFAVVLALTAVLAALIARRAGRDAKLFIDIAAAAWAAFAVAQAASGYLGTVLAAEIALIASAIAPTALSLAVFARLVRDPAAWLVRAALAASAMAGVAAMWWPLFALLPLVANVIALLVLGIARWRSGAREASLIPASAGSLAAGASAFLHSGPQALLLFAAASLLGIALAISPPSDVRVEQKRWASRRLAVRRKR